MERHAHTLNCLRSTIDFSFRTWLEFDRCSATMLHSALRIRPGHRTLFLEAGYSVFCMLCPQVSRPERSNVLMSISLPNFHRVITFKSSWAAGGTNEPGCFGICAAQNTLSTCHKSSCSILLLLASPHVSRSIFPIFTAVSLACRPKVRIVVTLIRSYNVFSRYFSEPARLLRVLIHDHAQLLSFSSCSAFSLSF